MHRSPERTRPQSVKAIHRTSKPQPDGWVVLTGWQDESPARATLRHANLAASEIPSFLRRCSRREWLANLPTLTAVPVHRSDRYARNN